MNSNTENDSIWETNLLIEHDEFILESKDRKIKIPQNHFKKAFVSKQQPQVIELWIDKKNMSRSRGLINKSGKPSLRSLLGNAKFTSLSGKFYLRDQNVALKMNEISNKTILTGEMKREGRSLLPTQIQITLSDKSVFEVIQLKSESLQSDFTYIDGSGNRYSLEGSALLYEPISSEVSSSGIFSGGHSWSIEISRQDIELLIAIIKKVPFDENIKSSMGSGKLIFNGQKTNISANSSNKKNIDLKLKELAPKLDNDSDE